MAKAVCTLGSLSWRIAPSSIAWNYQVDAVKIDTLGGQVVQILGATMSDLTVTGQFGQSGSTQSWQLAVEFQRQIKKLVDAQTLKAPKVTLGPQDKKITHAPIPFTYSDGVHNWSFDVLIKSLTDLEGGQLSHTPGKFSYGYALTLFIVSGTSQELQAVAVDNFISRLTAGVGWKISKFNSPMDPKEGAAFIAAHGGDVMSFVEQAYTGQITTTGSGLTGDPGPAAPSAGGTGGSKKSAS